MTLCYLHHQTCSLLRLEFNSEQCAYYTELDGIQLHGYTQKGNG